MGTAFGGVASEEGVHPGAAALVLARVPVRVKRAEVGARGHILDGVTADLRIPDGNTGLFFYANAEDTAEDFKHTGDDVIERKVGAQRLFVEVIERGTLFFGP